MYLIELFQNNNGNPILILEKISYLIIILSTCAILISILINFIESSEKNIVKKEKKSIVETGTMMLFFLVYYSFIKLSIGKIIINQNFHIVLTIIGLIIIIIGTILNIVGRFYLGKNWANHIKIYKNHKLIKKGPYSIVRHPLYASLIWIFYAGSFIYLNYFSFIANTLIFIPFMYYRAKQEETLILENFKEYKKYQSDVGMFFPKLRFFMRR
ncbi:isoprenylcysteine carboxylmethyltransferase family protein [archaeon]|nr:isoprenylcysteine carboxylmethyltransferase family protein [archaeon]MBT4351432.1 isoprenylcysteine carboxylmethyltransferase family protein [archaeon]MBT4647277.1 isoprenylcysteine carboxylmethyltransferase family protein [archaeon]MBT6821160.1 isoprenylcysteine carboxylmethyltransferase family protein [archaeon]MBT7391672.1 isoprenylcysteine carboxylmethyltransferase family protein [archaeon]